MWGFGSFFEGSDYADVDLAVLYGQGLPPSDCVVRAIDAESALMRAVQGVRFDVKTLNGAPLFFRHVVVCRGHLVFFRDDATVVAFTAQTWVQFFDFKPVWDLYNRRLAESFNHG